MCTEAHTAVIMPGQTQEVMTGLELTVHPAHWDPTHVYMSICTPGRAHTHKYRENHFLHGSILFCFCSGGGSSG